MAAIIGTEGPDTLVETIAVDTIEGLAGDDVIILDKGQTTLERDEIDGGAGSDRLVISRSVAGIEVFAFGPPGSTATVRAGSYANVRNVEHYTIYHLTGEGTRDFIFTGAGDDVYYFTATNNGTPQSEPNQVDLGSGQNDLLSIDASSVFDFGVEIAPISATRYLVWVGSAQRINFINVERLEFVGSALNDRITGLSGNDVIDGRGGNDTLIGMGGNDMLAGGVGDDLLDGGEGNDVLTFTTGSDTTDGGSGTDRLVLDARSVSGSVVLFLGGNPGPTYSGALTYAAGTVSYSGIESFTVHSSTGNFGDHVVTGPGDDVFHHYGRNDPSYAQDAVDLGGGSNDLLVADFSAVIDHAVTLSSDPLPSGHYLFRVAGNGKIDFTGVERIHFIGGAQGDTVFSLGGDDVLVGGAGSDRLFGGDGNDDISGGSSSGGISNELDGGNGDDIFRSISSGFDRINGGAGFDTAIIDYSDVTQSVQNTGGGTIAYHATGAGSAELTGIDKIIITTGSGNDSIVTLGGDDEIRTGAGIDALNGGAGNDFLDGGSGGDDMAGLAGNDTYVVDSIHDRIYDDSPTGGTDLVLTGLAAYTLPTGVENLTATNTIGHQFRGNNLDNIISGESGADVILLQDGGNDTGRGFAGNDVFYFGAAYTGADSTDGGVGRDAIVLQGNYVVTLGSLIGIESVSLQSGANASFGDTANNFYDFDVTTIDANVAAGQQLIVNAQSLRAGEDFSFDGSAETDGSFLVYGGHGVDDLTGGAGNDIFLFEGTRWGAGDRVDGGAGRDAVVISGGNGITHIAFAADSLTDVESISVNNLLASDPSQVPSYDFVLSNGNVGSSGTLIVNGSSIPGGAGQVVNIDGRAIVDGRLILFGSGGHDVITGGAGNDLIFGGGGQDSLAGGAGADVFRYDNVSDSPAAANDLIADFQPFGLDKIDLSRIDANSLAVGDQAFTWIGANAFSGAAGELRVRDSGGYRWVEGDTNGDSVADFAIQFYASSAPQVQADFIL